MRLLLGELPSLRLSLFYGTYEDFGQTAGLIDFVQFYFPVALKLSKKTIYDETGTVSVASNGE